MPIFDLMLPMLVHPYGHISESNKNGVPMRLDLATLTEKTDKGWGDKKSDIRGAGFVIQDKITNLSGLDDARLANAIHKMAYALGATKHINTKNKNYSDVDMLKRESGNRYIKQLLAITSLSDLLGGDLQFSTFDTGQPGILWNKRF